MENDKEPQNFDISKIFIKTLKNISLSYYKQSKLDEIVNAVEDLDIDKFVEKSYKLVASGANNIVDTFVDSWISNIQDKLEEEKIKITSELKDNPNLSLDVINEKLNKLPNIGDISKENFLNYQVFLKELIDKAGLNSEEEISKFLENYVNNVVKKSITDATASFPLTLAQFLASIFPVGTEPLVAVNKVNDMTKQLSDTVVSELVETIVTTGGRRKKRRKSKSKHFYINRIRQTLKKFYNY